MTKKTPEATRARLIQAAISIVVDQGAAQLTLNAVASTAQVSKGGLLHHFPTKEALLHGIDDSAMQMWSERFNHEIAQEPDGRPGRWSRAYIRTTFDRTPDETRVLQALARIIGVYPHLIERWRTMYVETSQSTSDDGLPEGRVHTIQVACDGLGLGQVLGLPLIVDGQRDALRADLLRLTNDTGNS